MDSFSNQHHSWMVVTFYLYLCATNAGRVQTKGTKKTLTIGGLYATGSQTTFQNASGIIKTVDKALEFINQQSQILPAYKLVIEWRDTKCQLGHGVQALFQHVNYPPTKMMLLGGICSAATAPIAECSQLLNLIQVSYGASSFYLSNKTRYPLFFRTIPSERSQGYARLAVLQYFKWNRIAILTEKEPYYEAASTSLAKLVGKHNIAIVAKEFLNGGGEDEDQKSPIEILQEKDARVIVGLFSEEVAVKVFCQAYERGFYGSKYVWILMGWYQPSWWKVHTAHASKVHCKPSHIAKASGNYIVTAFRKIGPSSAGIIVGKKAYSSWKSNADELGMYSGFAYDAVLSIALALNRSAEILARRNKTLDEFNYTNTEMAQVLKESLSMVKFQGFTILDKQPLLARGSGEVLLQDWEHHGSQLSKGTLDSLDFPTDLRSLEVAFCRQRHAQTPAHFSMKGSMYFNEDGERKGIIEVGQMQDNGIKILGNYTVLTTELVLTSTQFIWQEGKVPADQMRTVNQLLKISTSLFAFFCGAEVLGIIMAVAFLTFNIKKSQHRFIKMSSPRMNNIIVIGAILIYISGILLGIDGNFVSPSTEVIVHCRFSTWIACIGFTLGFGGMFLKTWRVHKIFVNRTKKMVISDYQLFAMLALFIAIDLLVIVIREVIDPQKANQHFTGQEEYNNSTDTKYVKYYIDCTSSYRKEWLYVLYAYKGFMLAFGVFLAFETRNVTVPALNDSRYIGLSIYNVVFPCALGITVVCVIDNAPNVWYVVLSVLVVFCTSITLCFVFIPKISTVRADPLGKERPRFVSNLNHNWSASPDRSKQKGKVNTAAGPKRKTSSASSDGQRANSNRL